MQNLFTHISGSTLTKEQVQPLLNKDLGEAFDYLIGLSQLKTFTVRDLLSLWVGLADTYIDNEGVDRDGPHRPLIFGDGTPEELADINNQVDVAFARIITAVSNNELQAATDYAAAAFQMFNQQNQILLTMKLITAARGDTVV